MLINNSIKKSILVLLMASSILLLAGCGDSNSSNNSTSNDSSTQTASLVDSPVAGIDYNTSTQSGVTDDKGNFIYGTNDKVITFTIGNGSGKIKLGDFNLSKINSDHKVLIGELFNLDRNNTTNPKLIKVLRVLQSLDSDNNVSNGISITDNEKSLLALAVENNTSINPNLVDNNISTLQALVAKTGHHLIDERVAIDNYAKTVETLGYIPNSINNNYSTQTASLVDSSIAGIDYNSSTQSGVTSNNNNFDYGKTSGSTSTQEPFITGTMCNDGTYSSSTGRGACSHHGGIYR